jgi:hypothetical protein
MSLATGLSALSAATNLTRSLRDGLKSGTIKGDEISGRIGEIYDNIVDSKDALVEARDEIQQLKTQLSSFNDRRHIDSELHHDGYVYWRKHSDGNTSGPYCVFCWKKENCLVPLTHIPGTYNSAHPSKRYDCVSHGTFLVPTGAPTVRNVGW